MRIMKKRDSKLERKQFLQTFKGHTHLHPACCHHNDHGGNGKAVWFSSSLPIPVAFLPNSFGIRPLYTEPLIIQMRSRQKEHNVHQRCKLGNEDPQASQSLFRLQLLCD